MQETFNCTVAVAQISANPAYVDASKAYLLEPLFPDDSGEPGLHRLASLEEVVALRYAVRDAYLAHISLKLESIIRFAAGKEVEILLFPEYSVPAETLPLCKKLADELGVVVVAGTHVVTASQAAKSVYKQLQFPSQYVDGNQLSDTAVRQAICVILEPNSRPVVFGKRVLSKWESQLVSGQKPIEDCPVKVKSGKLQLNVLICIEALGDGLTKTETSHLPSLTVIPALSPSVEPFHTKARSLRLNEVCTLFANIAEFGGSKIFMHTGHAGLWFTDGEGTELLNNFEEGLVIADIDLQQQYQVRDSTKTRHPVRSVSVYPIVYPTTSDNIRRYLVGTANWVNSPSGLDMESIAQQARAILGEPLPSLLKRKLQHFVNHVAPAGVVRPHEVASWIEAIIVTDSESTDALRWIWSGWALEKINDLLISSRYPEKQSDLTEVYTSLNRQRVALGKRLPVKPTAKPPGSGGEAQSNADRLAADTPFLNRRSLLDKIRTFSRSAESSVMVLSGMRGIGKTALLREAFRQVIPSVRRRLWIHLTEGVSYERFLSEFADRSGIPIQPTVDLSDRTLLADLESRVGTYVATKQRALIVIDEFQYLLDPGGEFNDHRIARLLTVLSSKAEEGGNKFFFVSDVRPKLPLEIESRCKRLALRGLEDSDTAQLVRYWFEDERGDLPTAIEDPPQRFVSFLGGHPLAAKIGAGLWAEQPSEDPSDRVALFDKLRDRIVPFILQHYTLSRSEKEFLTYASIFRLPVSREVFVTWGGDDAADVLDSFTGRFLVDASEEGYVLHPLIGDAFKPRGFNQKSAKYHRTAGEHYSKLLDQARKAKGKLVPEYLGEAIHHFLAAGDRTRVQGLAFYKSELRQVALSHYKGRAYDQALVEYRALADLDPGDADAHFHLALLYGRRRQWSSAEEQFEQALKLSPKDHRFLQGFGAVKMRGDLLLEAEELLHAAHDLAPRHGPTLVTLGELAERKGRENEAQAYYEDAIDADDESSYAHLCLARSLRKTGDLAGALYEAKAAMSRNPTDAQAQQLVSALRNQLGEAESSISEVER